MFVRCLARQRARRGACDAARHGFRCVLRKNRNSTAIRRLRVVFMSMDMRRFANGRDSLRRRMRVLMRVLVRVLMPRRTAGQEGAQPERHHDFRDLSTCCHAPPASC